MDVEAPNVWSGELQTDRVAFENAWGRCQSAYLATEVFRILCCTLIINTYGKSVLSQDVPYVLIFYSRVISQRLGPSMYWWQSHTMILYPVQYERRCSKRWLGLSAALAQSSIFISVSLMTGSQQCQKTSADELQLHGYAITCWTNF